MEPLKTNEGIASKKENVLTAQNALKPSPAFIGASWIAMRTGMVAYIVGLVNADMELNEKGYFLFGEKGIEKMKFSNGESDNWKVATLIIKKKESSEIIKIDLNEQKASH